MRGTQFRGWANKVLKEYLIKGYAVNQQVKIEQLEDLKNTVRLLSNVIEHKQLTLDEANGLLRVITDYTYGLDTLDKYDFQQLEVASTTPSREFRATYEEAMGAIHCLVLILRCLLFPVYHNTPASEHKPDSDEY